MCDKIQCHSFDLEDDLACAVVKMISGNIKSEYSKIYREAGKPWDEEEKFDLISEVLDTICDLSNFDNFAITGDEGKRYYEDFNKLMAKGGNLSI